MAASLKLDQDAHVVVPTGFSKVPLELLLRMTNDLTTRDIANLRLTCRSIEIALFETFAKEFFTKKQFMLTLPSLTALIDIAKSRLGYCLKHVIFGTDYYAPDPKFDRTAPQVSDTRIAISKYTQGFYSQQALLESGHALTLLTSAFAALSNLHTVGIRDYASELRKNRDGSGVRWNSYGATTVLHETGVNLIRSSDHYDIPNSQSEIMRRIFRLVLQALGSSGANPSSIEVLRRQGAYLRAPAFYIPDYLEATILPVLHNLETIFLPIQLTTVPGFPQGRSLPHIASPDPANPGSSMPVPCPDYTLRQFLGHLGGLKHLRLNLHHGERENAAFFRWLGETDNPPTPCDLDLPPSPPPVRLGLVELNLGYAKIDPADLLRIVHKFAPTLQRLELWRMCLDGMQGQGQGHPPSDQDASTPVSLWTKFLKSIRAIPGLELSHLMIGDPSQKTKEPANDVVFFKSLNGESSTIAGRPAAGTQLRSYTGHDVKGFIKELEKDLQVQALPAHSHDTYMFGIVHNNNNNQDEDADEDEDEDEDEEMSDSDSEN